VASLVKQGSVYYLDIYQGIGRPRIRRRIGTDRAEAQAVVDAINEGQREGGGREALADVLVAIAEDLRDDSRGLAELVEDFLSARGATVAASTLSWYGHQLERFAADFSKRTFRVLTLGQVVKWISVQPSAANATRSLRTAGNYWHQEDLWPNNPLMRLKGGQTKSRLEILSEKCIVTLEKKLAGAALEGPFLAGVYAGLRASEICNARLEFLDRRRALLAVRPFRLVDGGKVYEFTTKNRKERVVPVHRKILSVAPTGREGWLFTTAAGGHWNRHNLYRQMKAEAGCRLHTLRHTFVSRLLARGVGASVARDLAGHSSIAVTDGYAHTQLVDLRRAIRQL